MNGRAHLLLTLGAGTLGAAGCLAGPQTVALQRASHEFACAGDKVAVVQRGDISDSVYDVAACGHRARYSCFWVGQDATASVQCVREPDPSASDPDPVALAGLPRPPSAAAYPSNMLRICARDDGDCLARSEDGSWRWRPPRHESSQCGGASCL
jgi:hypothetical protein